MLTIVSPAPTPTPTPTPTPLLIQLVSENETPWWWGSLLTGSFIIVAAVIALISLRLSDHRKLAREDRRQWDTLLKDGFTSTSTALHSIRELVHDKKKLELFSPGETHARATAILDGLRVRTSELRLIAGPSTVEAMEEVVEAVEGLVGFMHDNQSTKTHRRQLSVAEQKLLHEVQKSLRITSKKPKGERSLVD